MNICLSFLQLSNLYVMQRDIQLQNIKTFSFTKVKLYVKFTITARVGDLI